MICDKCGNDYDIGDWIFCPHGSIRERRPFKGWVDENISDSPVEITSLSQWNRMMKANNMELRDGLRPGDISARKDKCEQIRREQRHAR
jgi:hypothetical protein